MRRVAAAIRRRPRKALGTGALVVLAVIAGFARAGGGSAPDVPTAEVRRGDFVDALEIRGEIKPLKAIVLAAPMQSGELQILKLAQTGTAVEAGDVVVQFDSTTLRRTVQEKESELKQAEAEIEQAIAQSRITEERNATDLMRSRYDVERAKLELNKGDTVPRIDLEKAKLVFADAQQKLRELETRIRSDAVTAEADVASKRRKREKALFDLQRAQKGLQNLELRAPASGVVNVLTNHRAGGPWGGGEVEFRQGDRAWPGASILELPDLSSIHLEARLDEADRGRLHPGLEATIRIEAVPGREFKARIERISVLARADFSSGWPPNRNFELGLVLLEADPKIRPGMTAFARTATDRVPDVVLVPSEAVFQRDGYPVVYRLNGSAFDETRVTLARRGREQAIVSGGVVPGDRIASRRPAAELVRRAE